MKSVNILVILLISSCQLLVEMCIEENSPLNQSFDFSMLGSRNQTGHWGIQFLVDKTSNSMIKNWKVNLKQRTSSHGDTHSLHLLGSMIVPPPKPNDYELFQGVGYYKFHHNKRVTFNEAQSICAKECGHLAIINSDEESNVLKIIYDRYVSSGGDLAFIGFYDRNKAQDFREFVTIFGQPLNETGFMRWRGNDPNNGGGIEFCGCVFPDGLIGDVSCEVKASFFCEYDFFMASSLTIVMAHG